MKGIFIAIFCSTLFLQLSSQKLPNFKDNVKDSLYTYFNQFDQKIELQLRNADPGFVDVKIPLVYGSSWKVNDSTYFVRFNQVLEEVKIKLYYKNLPVDIITAKVDPFPSPNVLIEGSKNAISRKVIKQGSKFTLDWNTNVLKGFELFSCRVTIIQPAKDPFTLNLRSQDFSAQFIAILTQAAINSQVIFDDFKIKTPSSTIMNLENKPCTFKVVE